MAVNMTGAAQGAAIGTAIMPGIGTAVGALAGAFMGGSSGAGQSGAGASGGPTAAPTAAQAAAFGSGLDGSGWSVVFGNGNSVDLDNRQDKTIRTTQSADATASQSPYLPGYSSGVGGLTGDALGMGVPSIVWYALFGFAAWRIYSSKK